MGSSSRLLGPAPRPCDSCPYRVDVPSGVWEEHEYDKLPPYDQETPYQPIKVFMCHQQEGRHGRLCAGWVGCHDMDEMLSLRIALADGSLGVGDMRAIVAYESPVELWASGADAAEHGKADIRWPGARARRLQKKVVRQHPTTNQDSSNQGKPCRE